MNGAFKETEKGLRALEKRNRVHTLRLSDHTLTVLGSIQPTCQPRLLPLLSLLLPSPPAATCHTWHGSHSATLSAAQVARALSGCQLTAIPARPWLPPIGSHVSDVSAPYSTHSPSQGSAPPPPCFSRLAWQPNLPWSLLRRRSRESKLNQEGAGLWRARARTHARRRPAGGTLAPGLAARRARGSRTQQVGLRRRQL